MQSKIHPRCFLLESKQLPPKQKKQSKPHDTTVVPKCLTNPSKAVNIFQMVKRKPKQDTKWYQIVIQKDIKVVPKSHNNTTKHIWRKYIQLSQIKNEILKTLKWNPCASKMPECHTMGAKYGWCPIWVAHPTHNTFCSKIKHVLKCLH